MAAPSAALEGRRPGCSSAVRASRPPRAMLRIARLAPPATTASPLRGNDGAAVKTAAWAAMGRPTHVTPRRN